MGSAVRSTNVYAEFLHLLQELYEQRGDAWRRQMVMVDTKQETAKHAGKDMGGQELDAQLRVQKS